MAKLVPLLHAYRSFMSSAVAKLFEAPAGSFTTTEKALLPVSAGSMNGFTQKPMSGVVNPSPFAQGPLTTCLKHFEPVVMSSFEQLSGLVLAENAYLTAPLVGFQ